MKTNEERRTKSEGKRQEAGGKSASWAIFALRSSLLVLLFLFPACTDKPKTSDEDIKQVQYPEFVSMLESKAEEDTGMFSFLNRSKHGPPLVLDPRTEARYDAEHIPNAIHIFLPQIGASDDRLANATSIVVYGTGWTDPIGPAAAKRLMALGYNNVYLYRGGVEDWKKGGGKVESGPPATEPQP